MTRAEDAAELVHIAVPARYVEPVMSLIADLQRGGKGSGPLPKSIQGDPPELAGDWSPEDLRSLAVGATRTHTTIQAILDVLAEQSGERLSAVTVAAAIGVSPDRLRGALAGLTRLLRSRSMYELGLPLNRHNVKSGNEETTYYWLTDEEARRWELARGQEGGRGNG